MPLPPEEGAGEPQPKAATDAPVEHESGSLGPSAGRRAPVVSKLRSEFDHAPVCFISGILASADVLFRATNAIFRNSSGTALSTPSQIPVTSIDHSGLNFLIVFVSTILFQNVIAYVWYKLVLWTYKLPTAVLPAVYLLVIALISWLTNYNALNFANEVKILYKMNDLNRTILFVMSVLFGGILTMVLSGSLLFEYESYVKNDWLRLENVAYANAAFYIVFGLLLLLIVASTV